MMYKESAFLAALLPSLATAQRFQNYVQGDSNSSAPFDGYDTFRAAAQSPLATRQVDFVRYRSSSLPSTPRYVSQNWTWTLGISDVHMPNASSINLDTGEPYVPDAHVAYTTYNFTWPGQGNLNEVARADYNASNSFGTPVPTCLYFIQIDFPQNVSDRWDSSSSNCSSAIGEECQQAILQNFGIRSGCASSNFPFTEIRGNCSSSFGAQTSWGYAVSAHAFGNASAPANATSLANGGTWAWRLGDPFAPGNTTALEIEEGKLRILAMTSPNGRQLLCNRISEVSNTAGRSVGEALSLMTFVAAVAAIFNTL